MLSFRAFAFICVASLLLLAGCATGLPDVSELMREASRSGEQPKISGPEGKLSERKTEKILSGLEQQAGPTQLLRDHVVLMEALTGHLFAEGNKATLLVDGPATYAAIFEKIGKARDHVNIETYELDDDDIGRKLGNLLLQKRMEGLQVNLIYDGAGCVNTPALFFDRLKKGGINVVEYNPIDPLKARTSELTTHRDHRKIVVVDGKVAFTGGVNFSSVYSGGSPVPGESEARKSAFGWRDTHVMIEGPAAAQFQRLFLETWQRQKGPALDATNFFPVIAPQGEELVVTVDSSPGDSNRLTYIMYVAAIKEARRSVHITNSYFVPDHQTMEALTNSAKRGMDVVLVLPGMSDQISTLYAGRSRYEDLLEAGVKVYERGDRVLHAKTAVIDGVWSTIGSTNFDLWSFYRNNEINAVILGTDFAIEMEDLFRKDIALSKEVTREEWSNRSLYERFREWIARLFSYWL